MIYLVLALLSMIEEQSNDPYAKQSIAIAERFVAALKGTADFQDGDFVKPLAEADKTALRKFGKCKMKGVGHMLMADPKNSNVLVRQFNDISVRMHCKGARWDMPVGLSLHLEGGKIAKIETHNADLMRVD